MKILILCNYATGLYSFRSLLIKTLIENGNSVSAVVPKTKDSNELNSEKCLREIGCRLIYLDIDRRGMNPIKDFKLYSMYSKLLRCENPNLVITYTIKPNIYGGIACRLAKVPYAVNFTGLGTAFEGNVMVKKIVCALYKIALKRAKIVFFENSENRDIIVNLGLVERGRTKVLAGAGVDLEKFSFVDYPSDDGEIKFLFIGRVMREKGINELISAMRRLKSDGINCSLDVVGWLEEDFSETIKICEKDGWLRFHGPQNDVRPFIASSHCFVLPSYHEGMANTNLECAASGRPVITSDIHGCLEAVNDGVSGYLARPKNVDSLYDVMKKFVLLSYPEKAEMGINGRHRMEEFFDKRIVVQNTIEKLM